MGRAAQLGIRRRCLRDSDHLGQWAAQPGLRIQLDPVREWKHPRRIRRELLRPAARPVASFTSGQLAPGEASRVGHPAVTPQCLRTDLFPPVLSGQWTRTGKELGRRDTAGLLTCVRTYILLLAQRGAHRTGHRIPYLDQAVALGAGVAGVLRSGCALRRWCHRSRSLIRSTAARRRTPRSHLRGLPPPAESRTSRTTSCCSARAASPSGSTGG